MGEADDRVFFPFKVLIKGDVERQKGQGQSCWPGPLSGGRRLLLLPVALGEMKRVPSRALNELIHPGHGIAVELKHLVKLPEVITESEATIWLWDHHDWAGPRAEAPALSPRVRMCRVGLVDCGHSAGWPGPLPCVPIPPLSPIQCTPAFDGCFQM